MSKIEWTDETWNPIAGCSKVSAGCTHCYAETMAGRLEAMGVEKYCGLTVLQGSHYPSEHARGPRSHRVWTGKIAFDEAALLAPLRRKKPTRYFVNSMSDLFHEGVTDEQIDRVFGVMALCPQHTFQVLTKRPERMLAYWLPKSGLRRLYAISLEVDEIRPGMLSVQDRLFEGSPLPNVWLGVSVENQATADERIPLLLQTPAAVRFISAEPLLGPVNLSGPLSNSLMQSQKGDWWTHHGAPQLLDWVIAGGESGPGARPMHPEWARSLRDQCQAAGVAFFFKQWGEYRTFEGPLEGEGRSIQCVPGAPMRRKPECRSYPGGGEDFAIRVGKKAAGALLDGREWRQMPGEAR